MKKLISVFLLIIVFGAISNENIIEAANSNKASFTTTVNKSKSFNSLKETLIKYKWQDVDYRSSNQLGTVFSAAKNIGTANETGIVVVKTRKADGGLITIYNMQPNDKQIFDLTIKSLQLFGVAVDKKKYNASVKEAIKHPLKYQIVTFGKTKFKLLYAEEIDFLSIIEFKDEKDVMKRQSNDKN